MIFALAPARLVAQVDVIRGRVTSAEGTPLAGVRVTATSIPGNVTKMTRSDSRGGFQLAFPGGQGDYIMGFSLVGYNFRQFEIKRTVDQDVLLADARLAPMQLDTVVTTAPVQQRVSRDNKGTTDVSGTEQVVTANSLPPELQGNLAAIAASLPGVLLIPGGEGGLDAFSVLGLSADANLTTLNGLSFSGSGLPRDAAISASLNTSPFDASRGGFSGANLNLSSGSGSNFKTRGLSFVASAPQLQWTDQAARALGTTYTNLSLGGLTSGPIKLNKAFYNISYQLDRYARINQSLTNTNTLGLLSAGVARDSVTRLLGILTERGVPTLSRVDDQSRLNDNGSVFGSIDIQPPSSLNGQSYGIAFNGNFNRQSPVGGGATQLTSSSGDYTYWSGGAQLRTNRYIGLILSESSIGANVSESRGSPYLRLPAGRVRVNSDLEDGASGVQTLSFGGNQGLSGTSSTLNGSFQNTLSWFDEANKHRIKLSTELQYASLNQNLANNLLGTFSFNSLAELEAGRPASFSRQLTTRVRNAAQYAGAMSLGDSWRRSADVQIQYGVRVDAARFATSPVYNAEVDRVFDRRNDRLPMPLTVSPRIGFSWTVGSSDDVPAFAGAFTPPKSVIRGGVGVFTNGLSAAQAGSALDNTGLPSGVQQLVCSGAAVPTPDWAAYASNASGVPDRCADGSGATVFANASPNVTLFSKAYTPQRSVRSNLSWQGPILGARYSLNLAGTYALNLNQQQAVDLNFRAVPQFALALEGDRPVFVAQSSIDSLSGAIASRDARVSTQFNRVTELRSDISSRTTQFSIALSPIQRTPARFRWSAAYTLTSVREEVPGFQSTSGNPLETVWATSGIGPHQFNYSLRYNFFNLVLVNWSGQFRSGSAFTPTVAGDINGDGYSNDRAFVYDPMKVSDPLFAAGLQELYASLPGSARKCLERQFGRVAERNSCRAPWSSSASLSFTLDRAKFRMPPRASLSFSVANPLGAADLAINGSGKLKGWGQNPFPDQSLLYVRGFDPQAKRYRYEVNQRFGQTRPQFLTLRAPVSMTLAMRVDLGPTRERQRLVQELNTGRRAPGLPMGLNATRAFGAGSISNPIAAILRQQDSLHLTPRQSDSLAAMNRTYAYQTDSIWTPVAKFLVALPAQYAQSQALDRYKRARLAQIDLMLTFAPAVTELLTPGQKRKLPPQILNALDPRILRFIRSGTGLYVSGVGELSR